MPSTPFSPRARGCSAFGRMWDHIKEVFPACAGMFLKLSKLRLLALSFPRVRGDVPLLHGLDNIVIGFSPRARGCSGFQRMGW